MTEFETIKSKIVELEAKRDELAAELGELSQAITDSFEDLLLGKVDEKTIEEAKEKYESLTTELSKTEEYIQRAKTVRKKVGLQSIPFFKQARAKKVEAIRQRYDSKVAEVIAARNEFIRKIAELGSINNEVEKANDEVNALLVELGEKKEFGSAINERKLFSPEGYTSESDCLGILVNRQNQAYSSGVVPNVFGGVK